ncbi:MAG: RidA family protein [Treponema sp.]|jgi:enamine deaminase RidA (YjgF/YER057c/UK114 family)|nr:RidA family protein [Treponema sp.]
MDVYARLKELNLTLPELSPSIGIYKPVRQAGNCLYVSGQVATKNGEPLFPGKVGAEVTIEQAQEAARYCVLNALSNLHQFLGDLNKIKGLIKTLAFIQSADGFSQQTVVANGASGLLRDIWGEENGLGARSAIGVNELPRNVCVEIEFIFEV